MKAMLLHGTDGNSSVNWFPWMTRQLQEAGWQAWTPDLPQAHAPNTARYNAFLQERMPWPLDAGTAIIGHSSGCLAALGLLQAVDTDEVIDACYLVGAFKNDLGWPALSGLFERPYDFERLRKRARRYVFIHSDNDPYCPLSHAEYLAEQLRAELIVLPGQGHFNIETDARYAAFPFLLDTVFRRTFER